VLPIRDDLPTRRPPVLTVALIAANVAAFLWQILVVGLPLSVEIGGVVPLEVLAFQDLGPPDLLPPPLTVLTSMFLHGGFGHIAGNMLFLWIFGNNVEDVLGRGRFLAFYLASGVFAALAQVAASWAAGDLLTPMVGASGAIAGVLAGYVVLFPRARVLTWLPPFWLFELPALLVIGGWIAMQVLGVFFGGGGGGGVAFAAHVGGFIAGWAQIRWWLAFRRRH
jgi:membrane associated rhomboid family serine protease